MTRLLAICAIIAGSALAAGRIAADDGPSAKVPELKALDNYVGSWDVQVTSTGLQFTKGQASAKWVLDGRFVRQTGELLSPDGSTVVKVTTLMTYDPAKKVYRNWTFTSDGFATESEGTWDAKARVMTLIGRKDENGVFSTTTANFSAAGVETWRIVHTDGSGKAVSEMAGKNTRKKQ